MHAAFEILGYRSEHGMKINKRKGIQISLPLDNEKVMEVVAPIVMQADAFSDFPYPMLYRELDKNFPGSKFILTTRETQAWINSVHRHFLHRAPDGLFEWIYGVPTVRDNRSRFIEVYETHNAAVRKYFENRPHDFLELSIELLKDFQPICEFLNLPCSEEPFPIKNRGKYRGLRRRFKPVRDGWKHVWKAPAKIRKLVFGTFRTNNR